MTGLAIRIALVMALLTGAAQALDGPFATPEAHGFSSDRLAQVLDAAKASGEPLHSLTLVRSGDVVLDAAFYPYDGATLHDMASVTKSVTTTLVAIAAAEGRLDLDAPMLSFFGNRPIAHRDARKEAVTLRHLMQNTSGLACVGAPEEVTLAQMEASADFVQFALDLPMAAEPGTRFDYCSPGMHILSAVLQQATGRTAFDYAKEKLFAPLGITDAAWDPDPQGVSRGWGDLHLRPGDMVALGRLWLAGGRWNGSQIIPAAWLRAATTQAVKSDRHEDYGYGFWVGPKDEPIPYFFASGRGGQRILVAPALELVIVTTGGGFDPGHIVDPVVQTLLDPGAALLPDPAGEKRLADAIARVKAPPAALPVPALPAIAAAISGRTYAFSTNAVGVVSLRLDFPGEQEATLTLSDSTGIAKRPVGLDGVYRWSQGPNGVRYGLSAGWIDPGTLTLDYNTIGDIRAYTITARFSGDAVEMTITQRDEAMSVTLDGRAP